MTDRTDAQLVLQASDPDAFAELYRRHASSVYDWCRRRLDWAAADLTAETFAQAWLSRGRFRDERDGSALPWLLGIARNMLRESARRDRIETRAREKLGLPLDLASEDGYTDVDRRPRRAGHSPRRSSSSLLRSGGRSSCASSRSCPTAMLRSGSRSARPQLACASRARCAGSP
jgi:DNA-directed RNA polymerase specialized sigma24 family protein